MQLFYKARTTRKVNSCINNNLLRHMLAIDYNHKTYKWKLGSPRFHWPSN